MDIENSMIKISVENGRVSEFDCVRRLVDLNKERMKEAEKKMKREKTKENMVLNCLMLYATCLVSFDSLLNYPQDVGKSTTLVLKFYTNCQFCL